MIFLNFSYSKQTFGFLTLDTLSLIYSKVLVYTTVIVCKIIFIGSYDTEFNPLHKSMAMQCECMVNMA